MSVHLASSSRWNSFSHLQSAWPSAAVTFHNIATDPWVFPKHTDCTHRVSATQNSWCLGFDATFPASMAVLNHTGL